MSAFKTMFTIARTDVRLIISCQQKWLPVFSRAAHTQDLTNDIQYISNDHQRFSVDSQTMKLSPNRDRPLCVLLKWLMAKPKHVMKYANIYLEQGFDVLSVGCTPWQLMWPPKRSQLVATDLLRFLSTNATLDPIVLHGFSVGGYLWGELCIQAMADKHRYQGVLERVHAQVWDSVVDFTEVTIGVPAALFPRNKALRTALQTYMEYHMKAFYQSSTVHHVRSSEMFQYNPCHAPALLLVSSRDTISPESTRRKMADSWTSIGIQCTSKVFEKSLHVQHFSKYPKEYLSALYEHLDAANLLSQPEKLRMRM